MRTILVTLLLVANTAAAEDQIESVYANVVHTPLYDATLAQWAKSTPTQQLSAIAEWAIELRETGRLPANLRWRRIREARHVLLYTGVCMKHLLRTDPHISARVAAVQCMSNLSDIEVL